MGENRKVLDELECGDIIKINFSPTKGHEQAGYRPAVVLTNPKKQNRLLNGMASVAPITHTRKSFPMHIELDSRTKTQGAVLMEHHRMIDLNSREFQYIEKMPKDKLKKCKEIYEALYEKLLSM